MRIRACLCGDKITPSRALSPVMRGGSPACRCITHWLMSIMQAYKQLYSHRSARTSAITSGSTCSRRKQRLVGPLKGPWTKLFSRSYGHLRSAARQLRLDSAKELKSLKGKKPAGAYVYVATTYPDWRKAVLKTARAVCNGSLVEKKELLGALKKDPAFAKDGPFAKQAKLAMQFGSFQHDYAAEVGLGAFDDVLPFSQVQILEESKTYVQKNICGGDLDITIVDLDATPTRRVRRRRRRTRRRARSRCTSLPRRRGDDGSLGSNGVSIPECSG